MFSMGVALGVTRVETYLQEGDGVLPGCCILNFYLAIGTDFVGHNV